MGGYLLLHGWFHQINRGITSYCGENKAMITLSPNLLSHPFALSIRVSTIVEIYLTPLKYYKNEISISIQNRTRKARPQNALLKGCRFISCISFINVRCVEINQFGARIYDDICPTCSLCWVTNRRNPPTKTIYK